MAESDISGIIRTLDRLTSTGDAASWSEFLEQTSPLILQILRLLDRNADNVADAYIFVCRRLKLHRYRRLRQFDPEAGASFPTWFRVVVRNLYIDWRRSRQGRRRQPRAITRLPELSQEVYRAVFEEGLSERESFESLRALFPVLTETQFDSALEQIHEVLGPRQRWLLASRQPRLESLTRDPASDRLEMDPPSSSSNPEARAASREEIQLLRRSVSELPTADRLLLQLRYEQGLSFDRIAQIVSLGSGRQADRRIEEILETLRKEHGTTS